MMHNGILSQSNPLSEQVNANGAKKGHVTRPQSVISSGTNLFCLF